MIIDILPLTNKTYGIIYIEVDILISPNHEINPNKVVSAYDNLYMINDGLVFQPIVIRLLVYFTHRKVKSFYFLIRKQGGRQPLENFFGLPRKTDQEFLRVEQFK